METESKYLPQLLAERDSLDSSFTHATKLISAGKTSRNVWPSNFVDACDVRSRRRRNEMRRIFRYRCRDDDGRPLQSLVVVCVYLARSRHVLLKPFQRCSLGVCGDIVVWMSARCGVLLTCRCVVLSSSSPGQQSRFRLWYSMMHALN